MRTAIPTVALALLAAAFCGAAPAQPPAAPARPASAAEPAVAASRWVPARNAAVTAAENAKEPGVQRPQERVLPQLRVPLASRSVTVAASAPAGTGTVDDGAARCVAARTDRDKAACERARTASQPLPRTTP